MKIERPFQNIILVNLGSVRRLIYNVLWIEVRVHVQIIFLAEHLLNSLELSLVKLINKFKVKSLFEFL
jgi:hypothetical protein